MDLTRKVAQCVCGNKLIFRRQITVNVSVYGKLAKVKAYVLKNNTPNLFETDWTKLFNLWGLPISSFCMNEIYLPSTNMMDEKILRDLENKFPDVFWEGLGKCSKIKVTFELYDNAVSLFKPKHSIPFAALGSIKEMDKLENLGVISPVDFSEWSALRSTWKRKIVILEFEWITPWG